MDAKEIAALADRIAEARRSRKVMDFLAADTATLSEADSYKVQFAVHDRLTADGKDAMAGWKVALTLPSQYEPMKLSGPVFAGIYQSGVRQSGAVFEKGWPIKAGIECEMVARMSKDVTAGQHPLYGRDDQAVRRQLLLRRRSRREPLRRRHQGERARPHRRRRAAGGLHRRHRDQGLAEARLRRRKGPLPVRGQGNRRRARHQRHGRRPDLARLARQQAHRATASPCGPATSS